jgi:hypothetical protein
MIVSLVFIGDFSMVIKYKYKSMCKNILSNNIFNITYLENISKMHTH